VKNRGNTYFDKFTFNWDCDELRLEAAAVKLRPKTLALLRVLLQRPGELIGKEELTRLVWPGLAVTDVVLNVCVAELRRALGDAAAQPRFLETVHRRGFRFIAPVSAEPPAGTPETNVDDIAGDHVLVGRHNELNVLWQSWQRARAGQLQVVIVSGDAGIGKTALLDRFVVELRGEPFVGRGQCLDLNAAAEPFLPVLEALQAVCNGPDGERVVELVRRHAPSWQRHLSGVAAAGDSLPGERGHESMVRELIAALNAITQAMPLILVLEDLHWSDPSTVDLVAALAQTRAGARLLVIGSVRPADAILQGHPRRLLRLAAVARDRVRELQLELLGEDSVRQYLERRLADAETAAALAPHIAARTDGSPLFMVAVVDHLIDDAILQRTGEGWRANRPLARVADEIPPSVTRLLREQIATFAARERAVLEAACVAGPSFASQAVAAGTERTLPDTEVLCAGLAERRFFVDCGPIGWPDGSVGQGYRFRHMIYHQVVDGLLTSGYRQALHLRIGTRLETGYGDRTDDAAGELAVHFGAAADHAKAFKYRKVASKRAIERGAYKEAIDHMRLAYAALRHLPAGDKRDRDELRLLVHLAPLAIAVHGVADPEAAPLAARMHDLMRRTDQQLTQFGSFSTLAVVWRMRGEIEIADAMAREMLRLAEEIGVETLQIAAHHVLGGNRFHCADFEPCRDHFERVLAIIDRRDDIDGNMVLELAAASSRCQLAVARLLGGQADAARRAVALARARHGNSEFSGVRAMLNVLAAWTFVVLREIDDVEELVTSPAVVDCDPPLPLWSSVGRMIRGWMLVQRCRVEAGLAEIESGYAEYVASQGESSTFDYQMLRADAYLTAGRRGDAMRVVDEGMETLARYKQSYFAAEMYRIRGELLAAKPSSDAPAAEACWREGLALARRQKAVAFELRLALSLAPLMIADGREAEGRRLLQPLLESAARGGETADVAAARRLLASSGRDRSSEGSTAPPLQTS
jgi:DNA-binding winged helix-turn-helix (wHTH) protein